MKHSMLNFCLAITEKWAHVIVIQFSSIIVIMSMSTHAISINLPSDVQKMYGSLQKTLVTLSIYYMQIAQCQFNVLVCHTHQILIYKAQIYSQSVLASCVHSVNIHLVRYLDHQGVCTVLKGRFRGVLGGLKHPLQILQ